MPELTLQRIPITAETDNRLRMLKARTGINPNILCRIGFCLSLEEPNPPPELPNPFKAAREINRYTLLGKYDHVFAALLTTKLEKNKKSEENIDSSFLGHVNRGIELLAARVKSVEDIGCILA